MIIFENLLEGEITKTPHDDNQKIETECYPTQFFVKSEDELMHEGLICAICLGVVRDAVKDPCGHVFGERCIKNWLVKNEKCPYS